MEDAARNRKHNRQTGEGTGHSRATTDGVKHHAAQRLTEALLSSLKKSLRTRGVSNRGNLGGAVEGCGGRNRFLHRKLGGG